jgi:hypothetical protein
VEWLKVQALSSSPSIAKKILNAAPQKRKNRCWCNGSSDNSAGLASMRSWVQTLSTAKKKKKKKEKKKKKQNRNCFCLR